MLAFSGFVYLRMPCFLFRMCLSFGGFPGELLEQHTRRAKLCGTPEQVFHPTADFRSREEVRSNSSFRVSPVGHLFLFLFSPCKTRKKPCVCAYYLHV